MERENSLFNPKYRLDDIWPKKQQYLTYNYLIILFKYITQYQSIHIRYLYTHNHPLIIYRSYKKYVDTLYDYHTNNNLTFIMQALTINMALTNITDKNKVQQSTLHVYKNLSTMSNLIKLHKTKYSVIIMRIKG